MKTIITVLFLLLLSQTVLAMKGYHKGDTIWYKFDNMLIEVASTNAMRKIPGEVSMDIRIRQIQQVLSEINIEEPAEDERIIITFQEQGEDMWVWNYKEIAFANTKRNSKTLVVFEDGSTYEKDYGRYCVFFSYRAMEMKIYVDELDDLNYFFSENFKNKTKMASAFLAGKFEEKERKKIIAWLDLRGDEVKANFSSRGQQNYDMLLLSAGIGSGWVKNTFVSDVTLRMGLSFGKKGLYKNAYYIDWNMMYDFSESNDSKFFELNHFVSLSYDRNFSNNPEQDKWYGFSVGYLVKRNNDFFKENTFRIAINKKVNDTFSVKPELYFNDFFKNVYPGIRVSVAF
ncbi:hypothetical protein [uncultured Draconibacterium sp.]|uniref:hypothetical protein n=1 Tax=uncultured Draconibacterium sp. TaxID=1573823 RepID=UPI0032618972